MKRVVSTIKNALLSLTLASRYHPNIKKIIFIISAPVVTALMLYISFPYVVNLLYPSVKLQPLSSGSTTIYDETNQVIATLYNPEIHYPYTKKPPKNLIDILLLSEDKNFFNHKGFDLQGTTRALVNNIKGLPIQGGSTITQQLVRNRTNVGTKQSYKRKILELFAATKLEFTYNKEEILKEYINSVYMGNGIRGIYTASRIYFRKELQQLNQSELALLVSTIPCPESCNPIDNYEKAWSRATLLLNSAKESKLIKPIIKPTKPVVFKDIPSKEPVGDPWVIDTVRRELIKNNIITFKDSSWPGGYEIHTSISSKAQQALKDSVLKVMGDPSKTSKNLDLGAVFINNYTGEINSIIGSRDFATREVNLALGKEGGGSGRQIGSVAKILTVIAAYDKGLDYKHKLPAPSEVNISGKPVKNYDYNNWGEIDMQTALTWSVNTYFTNLASEVSPTLISSVARKLGLNFPNYRSDERVTLGVIESSPTLLASTYSAIASDGLWVAPHIIKNIKHYGKEIYRAQPEKRQSITVQTAQNAQSLLRSVVQYGTGYRAKLKTGANSIDVIGKTGTTDNGADIWFVGATSKVTGAIWIGNPLSNTYVGSVPGFPHSGSGAPAEIWRKTMEITTDPLTPKFASVILPYPNKPLFQTKMDDEFDPNDLNQNPSTVLPDENTDQQQQPSDPSPTTTPTSSTSPTENLPTQEPTPSAP